MELIISEMLKVYLNLPEASKNVVNVFVVAFSGIDKYICIRYLQEHIDPSRPQKEYTAIVKDLIDKGLITSDVSNYDTKEVLKVELFAALIRQPKYINLIRKMQVEPKSFWIIPTNQHIREYLFGSFVEKNKLTESSVLKLITDIQPAIPTFSKLLNYPAYDKALMDSPILFWRIIDKLQLQAIMLNLTFEPINQFIDRNRDFEDGDDRFRILKGEILLQAGKLDEASQLIDDVYNGDSLLLKAQSELFKGQFARSIFNFEQSRVTDGEGLKISKIDFHLYYEFFYWLNFIFYPEALDVKKIDVVIRKKEKNQTFGENILLALLYFIKKDTVLAEGKMKLIPERYAMNYSGFESFFYLLVQFVIYGELTGKMAIQANLLSQLLYDNKRWLMLRELNFMIERSQLDVKLLETPMDRVSGGHPCLLSHLVVQEKWEQLLDGLLNLTMGKSDPSKKEAVGSRVCYFVNLEDGGFIQPILQTLNSKGAWSPGRNIALKRLKEMSVEGMTEQDRRIAHAVTYSAGYYGATEYEFDFSKAVVELCGHPLLFLNSNPSVSVELVKAQPEIFTEAIRNGIRLKTNIDDPEKKTVLIKETQTRFKLISLSPQQQSIIRMINKGVTIPARGKDKLLKTVSNLSSVITVHSDITDGIEVKSIPCDPRLRVQIIPLGDGLRAELFVKPLGSEPPYVKPGKGSKVVYGTVDKERCQAVRNLVEEKNNSEKLNLDISTVLNTDMSEEPITFTDPYDCLNLLEIIGKHTAIALVEWPEGERFRMKKSASFANLNLRVKGKGQWFELDGELNVDEDTVIALKELMALTRKSKGRFVELKSGDFLALTEDLKKQIDELEAFATIDKNSILVNRFASHALEEITSQAASFKADKSWKEFQKRIQSTSWTDATVPATLDAELRPYQEEGFRWMARLKTWDAGACLADDMGLGKTVQAIAMMLHLADKGPLLVVCPASVVPNWANELQKFAPTLNAINLKPGNRNETFASLSAFDILIITYGLLQSEIEQISGINWAMAVLDEAHAIKNTQTKSSKAAMNIKSDFKLVLTGTPIQNHLGELWNLFNFCNPGLLGTLTQFTDRYVKNDLIAQKNHLKKLITPFILRRTKNKVLDELPPKTEITYTVTLSDKEMAFYEALRREAISLIENNDGTNGMQHLQALAELTKLRLACCNTALVNKEIQLPSSKLEAFFEIVEELRANRHRALVFSQFVGHLTIVRNELDRQGIPYQYLDGSTSIPNRELAVKAFQSGKGELFLISLKAGGLGLNLTAADYVLHLDPWWNPAIEDQASDRAHRIGQLRPVTIYRLVAKNTIEEKIVRLHATKRDLADSLLEGTDQSAHLSTIDLLNLLKEV